MVSMGICSAGKQKTRFMPGEGRIPGLSAPVDTTPPRFRGFAMSVYTGVMTKTHGSLFSGYGGLDIAVEKYFGATTLWHSEVMDAAKTVLSARFPTIPNLGDITKIDWKSVPRVDILSGGSPCQDLSLTGLRKGMSDGTRSGLWTSMMDGVEELRPETVIWENVLGALSATTGVDRMKALGLVLYDLSCAGYDCTWVTVTAREVGAPHRRTRVFVVATLKTAPREIDTDEFLRDKWPTNGQVISGRVVNTRAGTTPPPAQLPTPAASDWRSNNYPADLRRRSPRITAWSKFFPRDDLQPFAGRTPPPATLIAENGREELDPKMVEWMMGLPDGWVTDVLKSRKDRHTVLGNGVVPLQAEYAFDKAYNY